MFAVDISGAKRLKRCNCLSVVLSYGCNSLTNTPRRQNNDLVGTGPLYSTNIPIKPVHRKIGKTWTMAAVNPQSCDLAVSLVNLAAFRQIGRYSEYANSSWALHGSPCSSIQALAISLSTHLWLTLLSLSIHLAFFSWFLLASYTTSFTLLHSPNSTPES